MVNLPFAAAGPRLCCSRWPWGYGAAPVHADSTAARPEAGTAFQFLQGLRLAFPHPLPTALTRLRARKGASALTPATAAPRHRYRSPKKSPVARSRRTRQGNRASGRDGRQIVPAGRYDNLPMAYYLLEYALIEDYLARRTAYREEHLALARDAHRRGELVLAGALAEPVDRAALIWRTDDRSVIERFIDGDPYVANGLVASWAIRPWNVVIGDGSG